MNEKVTTTREVKIKLLKYLSLVMFTLQIVIVLIYCGVRSMYNSIHSVT
jgi:hypothetical protein